MRNDEIFEGKNLSDLLKDIHDNALEKRKTIGAIISQLVGFIKTGDEAQVIAPLVKDFYDVGVKNDEQVVKVATIAQRLLSTEAMSNAGDSGFLLSDAEKERLMANAMQEINNDAKEVDSQLDTLQSSLK